MSDEKLIKPGVYSAKIFNYGILVSKAGKPNLVIDFECEGKVLRKYLGLGDANSKDYTAKVLTEMGYTSTKLDDFSEGKGLKDAEYFLVIENQEYNGKITESIKFINTTPHNQAAFLDKAEALRVLSGISLSAEIAIHLGKKEMQEHKQDAPKFDANDIPF